MIRPELLAVAGLAAPALPVLADAAVTYGPSIVAQLVGGIVGGYLGASRAALRAHAAACEHYKPRTRE